MGDALKRFLHLERPRPADAPGAAEPAIAGGERGRFDAVEPSPLWEAGRREDEALERESAARREAASAAEAEAARARRAAADALAREVGERERRRLERAGWGGGPPFGYEDPEWTGREYDGRPWALRLLGLIRDPRWRAAAVAAAIVAAVAAALWALARRDPRAILAVAVVLWILVSPPRMCWRGRWWR